MAKMILNGIHPYDGEYEIPNGGWTNRELHFIKQTCGVRAGELEEALQAGDVGVQVALTAVILKRAGHNVNVEILWDADPEKFDVIDDEQEADQDRPPASSPTTNGLENSSVVGASSDESASSSGRNGGTDGESSPPTPSRIGTPLSVGSADLGPTTSEN